VVAVRTWERVEALGEEAGLWCRTLVGGKVFGRVGCRVWRRVFGNVLVELGLIGLVVGVSRSLDGICLEWRCWCWRGLCTVGRLEEVVRRTCLLVVDIEASCVLFCF
jgi:hypothetical protein